MFVEIVQRIHLPFICLLYNMILYYRLCVGIEQMCLLFLCSS